ncbi:MAG TPA: sulfotransferase [Candidatus Omnitrophota bacterium]|nr:sulfotransferase [Candidatus Omnitrophota bacterium]
MVIGGLGGSGTRAVASIVGRAGFYLGSDLNDSLDNLWFTLLLKRPRWFYRQNDLNVKSATGLSILEKAMKGVPSRSLAEFLFLLNATLEISCFGHDRFGSGKGLWPFIRLFNILRARCPATQYRGWGWKEPNSHLFIESMARHFKGLRYIHVIRHGLDMAFSNNRVQLFNWGRHFGVAMPQSQQGVEAAMLDYWIKSNQSAVRTGNRILQNRFLLINFDDLCLKPRETIDKIYRFLDISPIDRNTYVEFCDTFHKPEYLGRYKGRDLSGFTSEQVQAVKGFGFSVTPIAGRPE